ncbi:MAG: 6-bladed beta-propeller [Candidatus Aminicenantes bacterium]|nr:6-bladed beta-propeller [Candidatus Aminicenantes bacterium]
MKKLFMILPLALILCFMVGCKDKEADIERFMEDGVEVVVNHLEPYKLKGEPSNLILEKVFSIDTERDDIVEIGLTDIGAFDVDSEGNIYLVSPQANENFIFKFDRDGNYIHSFCRMGQGPGEMSYAPYAINITSQNEITVTETTAKKLLIFNNNGNLLDETPITIEDVQILDVIPLENGNYFCAKLIYLDSGDYLFHNIIGIHDSDFKRINDLDEYKVPNYSRGKKTQGILSFCSSITRNKIYIGNDNRGYEIWVFDLDGNLQRKIRKEYEKIPIPKEFIEESLKALPEQMRKMMTFPEVFHPIQSLFTDEMGRLYVMTYEKGEDSGEYIFDIFNADGIFIGRKSLRAFNDYYEGYLWVKGKQNHLYCGNEKESGYKELVVYKMTWE